MCVIAHDLSSSELEPANFETRMARFKEDQPTTFKHSILAMIGGNLSVNPPDINSDQRKMLHEFFEKAFSTSSPSCYCCYNAKT